MGEEEPLPYIAFGDTVVPRLKEALTNGDGERIRRFTDFFEAIAQSAKSDSRLHSLLAIEVGEWLEVTNQEAEIAPWLGTETKRVCRYVPGLATQRRKISEQRAASSWVRRLCERVRLLKSRES